MSIYPFGDENMEIKNEIKLGNNAVLQLYDNGGSSVVCDNYDGGKTYVINCNVSEKTFLRRVKKMLKKKKS